MDNPDYGQYKYNSTSEDHIPGEIGCGCLIVSIIISIFFPPFWIVTGIIVAVFLILMFAKLVGMAVVVPFFLIYGLFSWIYEKIRDSSIDTDTIDRTYSDSSYGQRSSRPSKVNSASNVQTSQHAKAKRSIQPQSRPEITCLYCKGRARILSGLKSEWGACERCGRIFKLTGTQNPTSDTRTSQRVEAQPKLPIQAQSSLDITCPHCKGPARDMSSGYAKCLVCGKIFKYEEPETITRGGPCPHCNGDIRPLPGMESVSEILQIRVRTESKLEYLDLKPYEYRPQDKPELSNLNR